MEAQYYINMILALTRKLARTELQREEIIPAALTILQEMNKDRRVEEMKREKKNAREEPATARQIAYLKALSVKIENERLSKKEAAEMIKEALRKRKESIIKH